MTKAELVAKIARETGLNKDIVLTVVEQFMTDVKESLAEDESIYLRGFGSFITKTRAQKTARNISKETMVIIPQHQIPAFKPAPCFVSMISGLDGCESED